jgi:hypothetical protein
MRININLNTSFINCEGLVLPMWLQDQVNEFLETWDLHPEAEDVIDWVMDEKSGLQELIKWMQAQGWQVSYYEMQRRTKDGTPLSFGMEFAEDCQRYMTARLSQ